MSDQLENQTVFAQSEPVFQDPEQLPVDPEQEKLLASKKAKQKKMMFIGTGIFVFILVLLVMAMTMQKRSTNVVEKPTPTPVVVQKETLTPLQQSVKDAQILIDNADPSVNDYPFPPINFEVTLEPEN